MANVKVKMKDNGGTSNRGVDTSVHTFTITFDQALAAKPKAAKAQVLLYPNPAGQFVEVQVVSSTETRLRARLMNLVGVQVAAQDIAVHQGAGQVRFNLLGMPRGIYFIKLEGRLETTAHKIEVR